MLLTCDTRTSGAELVADGGTFRARPSSLLAYVLSPRVVRALVYWSSTKFTAGSMVIWAADDQVLLVRSRYGERAWGFPGGVMSRREDPVHCAVRELREETGVDVAARELRIVGTHTQRHARHVDHVYQLDRRRPPGGHVGESSDRFEIAETQWWPMEALPVLRREAAAVVARYAELFGADSNDADSND